jgi:hypothetical protein
MISKSVKKIKNKGYFLLLLILGVLLFEAPDANAIGNVVVPNATLGEFRHGTFPSLGNRTHVGVDLVAECGTAIYAFEDGKVIDSIDKSTNIHFNSLGYMVLIEHSVLLEGRKFYTIYLHMQEPPNVVVGDSVIGGQTKIGKVGSTGRSDGCHTHFEIRYFSSRLSKWGNIYGLGDKRLSRYFKENWVDPLKFISNLSSDDIKTSSKEIAKDTEKTDKMQHFTKKDSIIIHSVHEKAGQNQIYDDLYGLWAKGDCQSPALVIFNSKELMLKIYKNKAYFEYLISARTTSDFIIQQWKRPVLDGEKKLLYVYFVRYYPLNELNRKVLISFTNVFNDEQDIGLLPDHPPEGFKRSGMDIFKCDNIPSDMSFIHAEGIIFMKLYNDISVICEEHRNECVNHIFSIFDISKDKKLSKAEISRMIRIISYIAVVSGKGVAGNDEITGILGIVSIISPSIAGAIIDGSDYDNDGQLSIEEIFYDRQISSVVPIFEKFSFDIAISFFSKMFGSLIGILKIIS